MGGVFTYRSFMVLTGFDCANRTRRPSVEIGHNVGGGVAYQVRHDEPPDVAKAQRIAQDTLGEIDSKAICALPLPKR